MNRTLEYGHWGVVLIEDGQTYASLMYPVGPQGPQEANATKTKRVAENWKSGADLGIELQSLPQRITVGWYAGGRLLGTTECGTD